MKKIIYTSIAIVICLFSCTQLFAQYQISGRIVQEEGNAPLEYANVALTLKDSAGPISGVTSDAKGIFRLRHIPPGDYLLTASYLGFISKTVILNKLSKSIDLGDILLKSETNELETVTVTASNVTNRTDRLIVFVTDEQKARSSNGLNILAVMQLPRVIVNPITNEVALPGDEKLQFCINGVKAEHADVRALQPNDIIRIEYLDNPGLRYGKADAVINYILKRERSGGSVSLDMTNAVTTSFGDDQAAAKFNYGKSEFGLIYSVHYRNPTQVWKDQERTFYFEDGSSMQRTDKGIPGDLFSENFHQATLNYNLLNAHSYFNATVRYSFMGEDKVGHTRQYTSVNPAGVTDVYQGSNTDQHLPSVDLYYQHTLKNRQTILFNLVGTYIKSGIDQMYEEAQAEEPIATIISNVDGRKYSIIGEGIYEKIFENKNRFSAGLKHTQAFANNYYAGTVTSRTEMDQTDTYLYAEYAGKIDKFGYTGGVGLSRSWAGQGDDDYTSYTFRPKVTVQYNPTPSMFVRLKSEVYNTPPSLSKLSAVDQYIDTLQVMRGNPGLKPNLNYVTSLLFSWRKGGYGVNFNTYYHYCPDAIMEETFREDGLFVNTFANQRSWRKFNSELTLNGDIIKKYLSASITGGVNRFITEGHTYTHTHTNFYYRAQFIAKYKKLTGIFQAGSPYDHLAGESLNEGENSHLAMLMYNAGKFTAGAGVLLPFSSQYVRNSEGWNRFSPTKATMYANDFSRAVLLKFSWNFSYGRKAKSVNKRIYNEDKDTGILSNN
jgi:hypothetical protein